MCMYMLYTMFHIFVPQASMNVAVFLISYETIEIIRGMYMRSFIIFCLSSSLVCK